MEMTTPAGRNPIDENRGGLIGKSIDRVDGRLKVTGQAPYAYEVQEAPGQPAYGFIVEATIAKGTVADIDASAAERAPGVLLVMTYRNAPRQGRGGPSMRRTALRAPRRNWRATACATTARQSPSSWLRASRRPARPRS